MFTKIFKEYGSSFHFIEFFVDEENNEIGLGGGRIVDIKNKDGKIKKEQNLSIAVKDKRQILFINNKVVSDDELRCLRFKFINNDY